MGSALCYNLSENIFLSLLINICYFLTDGFWSILQFKCCTVRRVLVVVRLMVEQAENGMVAHSARGDPRMHRCMARTKLHYASFLKFVVSE